MKAIKQKTLVCLLAKETVFCSQCRVLAMHLTVPVLHAGARVCDLVRCALPDYRNRTEPSGR